MTQAPSGGGTRILVLVLVVRVVAAVAVVAAVVLRADLTKRNLGIGRQRLYR